MQYFRKSPYDSKVRNISETKLKDAHPTIPLGIAQTNERIFNILVVVYSSYNYSRNKPMGA
jgi:hypothetical protein